MSPTYQAVRQNVEQALTEDRADGDISAGLIDEQTLACAQVITRESGIFCGAPWVDETLKQLDETMHIKWQVADGAGLSICTWTRHPFTTTSLS